MKKDHSKAPILEAIKKYHDSAITPFTTPGHKCGAGVFKQDQEAVASGAYFNDISMQNGLDDRRETKGVQEEAEALAADAVGSEKTLFSTHGSSLSGHVAILSVADAGEKVLVARNTHKSLIGAIVMADVIPVFLHPEFDAEQDVEHGITPEHLEKMLNDNPDAKGVFIVSPTYYGFVSDVKSLAKICHKRNIPLIIDEAWGSHFPFHSELPESAMSCGADVSFGSVHKTMNGLGQSSIINIQGNLIDKDRFQLCFDLFESTSPSAVMLASIDAARRQMVLKGQELWSKALELSRKAREALSQLEGLYVFGKEMLKKPGCFDMDEIKLVIDVKGLGMSGFHAADWIFERFKITFELITHRHLMALISVADTDDTIDYLIEAVTALHSWAMKETPNTFAPMPEHDNLGTHQVMAPTKAFFSSTKKVAIEKAVGEVIAETVSPYPPGIPRLVPGELITQPIVDYLIKGRDAGMFVLDATDEKMKTLRVVKTTANN